MQSAFLMMAYKLQVLLTMMCGNIIKVSWGRYNVVPAQDIKQRYGENVLIVISSAIDRVYWSIARSWMSLVINILQQMLIFSPII